QTLPEPEPELSRDELIILLKVTINDLDINKSIKKSLKVKVKLLEAALESRILILQKLLGQASIKILQTEVKLLKKKKKLLAEDSEELLTILNKIEEKI